MAEEAKEPEGGGESKGGKLGLILMLAVMLLAIGGGLAVYFMVIAPKFADPGEVDVVEDPTDFIPTAPQYVKFDPSYVNLMREGDANSATLMYQVTFECADAMTLAKVEAHKARFVDMLNKLHGSRTMDEVDDIVAFQESVQRQAKQKANDLLKRLAEGDELGQDYVVTAVFHEQCMVAPSV